MMRTSVSFLLVFLFFLGCLGSSNYQQCPAVITYAQNPANGQCIAYPTPCAVPTGHSACSPDEVISYQDETEEPSEPCNAMCDDGNPCTSDFCDEKDRCDHSYLSGPLEGCSGDKGKCGGYVCSDGECIVEQKTNCCGNNICEVGETHVNCWDDCESCEDDDDCTNDYYDYELEECVNEDMDPATCCDDKNSSTYEYYDSNSRKCVREIIPVQCTFKSEPECGGNQSDLCPGDGLDEKYGYCREEDGKRYRIWWNDYVYRDAYECPERCGECTPPVGFEYNYPFSWMWYDPDENICNYVTSETIEHDEGLVNNSGWNIEIIESDQNSAIVEITSKNKHYTVNIDKNETLEYSDSGMLFSKLKIKYSTLYSQMYSDWYMWIGSYATYQTTLQK